MSEWIEHDGSGCPVAGNTLVHVKFRGRTDTARFLAKYLSWVHNDLRSDIVAYRIVS